MQHVLQSQGTEMNSAEIDDEFSPYSQDDRSTLDSLYKPEEEDESDEEIKKKSTGKGGGKGKAKGKGSSRKRVKTGDKVDAGNGSESGDKNLKKRKTGETSVKPRVVKEAEEADTKDEGDDKNESGDEEGKGGDTKDKGAPEKDDSEDSDKEDKAQGCKLSKAEEDVLNELKYDEEDVEDFLKDTENSNTRGQTDFLISKYNRLMSAVAQKEGKDFLPLENTPRQEVPKLLARFFKMMRTKDGQVYNASSYTTYLCCVTRYLADAFHPPLDVNDPAFKIVRTMVKRMKASAQGTKGKKPGDNASRVVAPRHLKQAWESGDLGRQSPDALAATTYMVATVGFGCRALQEVRCITNGSLVWGPVNPKTGVHTTVRLEEEWVCKNRNGDNPRVLEAQITADDEDPDTCMVRTLMEFQRRKTKEQLAPEAPLFWNISKAAREAPSKYLVWFKKQPMGRHTISMLLTNALTRAGVNCKTEKYSASSSRKVQLDGALDAHVPEVLLGKLAGQRSHHAKASYIHKKDSTHRAANIAVSRVAAGKEANYQEILSEVNKKDDKKDESEQETDETDEEVEMTVSQSRIMSDFGSIAMYEESSRKKKKKKSKKAKKEKKVTKQQQNVQPNLQQTLQKLQQQGSMGQQMMNIQQPMINLQQPMMNLQQPMMNLQQPSNLLQQMMNLQNLQQQSSLAQQMMNLQQPMISLQQPMMNLQQPMMNLQQPMMNVQQPSNFLQQMMNLQNLPQQSSKGKQLCLAQASTNQSQLEDSSTTDSD